MLILSIIVLFIVYVAIRFYIAVKTTQYPEEVYYENTIYDNCSIGNRYG